MGFYGILYCQEIVEVTSVFYDLSTGTVWNCRLAVIICEIPYHIRSTRKYKVLTRYERSAVLCVREVESLPP
jgi:hypothetical protein